MEQSLAHDTGACASRIRQLLKDTPEAPSGPVERDLFSPDAPPTPTCNTGVESASPRPPRPADEQTVGLDGVETEAPPGEETLTATVDYLRLTLPTLDLEEVLDLFAPEGGTWKHEERGRNFYRKRASRGDITLLYDGAQPGMGVHVEMSGKGCRQAEAEGLVPLGDWCGFLGFLRRLGGKLTRLDLAIDDRTGMLDKDVLRKHYREEQYACRAHGKSVRLLEDKAEGFTLYFGSRTSTKMIRIYDKAAQMGEEGHWMRAELETRDATANVLADQLARGEMTPGLLVAGALRGFLRFTEGTQTQACRRPEAAWWVSFLQAAAAVRLKVEPKLRSLEKAAAWVQKQCAPTLALLAIEAKAYGPGFFRAMIADGKRRLTGVHWGMLGFVGKHSQASLTPDARSKPRYRIIPSRQVV